METSDKKVSDVILCYLSNGMEATAAQFGIMESTIERYIRTYKKTYGDALFKQRALIDEIESTVTPSELKTLLKSMKGHAASRHKHLTFDGDTVTIGVISDTHIGSNYFCPECFQQCGERFATEGVDFVVHAGDVTEGMSNRAGHVLELTHIGYKAQRDYSVELFNDWPFKTYMIDGNHDRWFAKSNGAFIVEDICNMVPHCEFIGNDEGNIDVNGATVRLWHGEDGSSYAHSYRIQKVVEAFTGGEKPNVLVCGHVHKHGYFMERNIHCVSAGAMCAQSKWMRSTRKPNHRGFWIMRLTIGDSEVKRCQVEWFPIY